MSQEMQKLLISLVVDLVKNPRNSLSPICKMHNVSFSISQNV